MPTCVEVAFAGTIRSAGDLDTDHRRLDQTPSVQAKIDFDIDLNWHGGVRPSSRARTSIAALPRWLFRRDPCRATVARGHYVACHLHPRPPRAKPFPGTLLCGPLRNTRDLDRKSRVVQKPLRPRDTRHRRSHRHVPGQRQVLPLSRFLRRCHSRCRYRTRSRSTAGESRRVDCLTETLAQR